MLIFHGNWWFFPENFILQYFQGRVVIENTAENNFQLKMGLFCSKIERLACIFKFENGSKWSILVEIDILHSEILKTIILVNLIRCCPERYRIRILERTHLVWPCFQRELNSIFENFQNWTKGRFSLKLLDFWIRV